MTFIKKYKWLWISVLLIIFIYIYKNFNPNTTNFFPKCPFWTFTGLKCPGCGSQRAIHHLLNFELFSALKENILAVIFIPYIIFGFIYQNIKNPSVQLIKWRNIFYGKKATIIILIIVLSFWIIRNIVLFM